MLRRLHASVQHADSDLPVSAVLGGRALTMVPPQSADGPNCSYGSVP